MDFARKKKQMQILFFIALSFCTLVFFVPFFWVISTAIRPEAEVFLLPLRIFPPTVTLENFVRVFQYPDIPLSRWFLNSLVISSIGTLGTLAITSLAAYAFARLKIPGREVLFFFVLTSIMIPPESTLIPRYLITRYLGWFDTYQALILPTMANAFALFLMRQFFLGIPNEIEESAVLDGCSKWRIYWHMILPMSKPVLATLGIFVFKTYWNDFTWPLVATNSLRMRPLTVGLAVFQGQYYGRHALIMSGVVLSIVPVVIVYLFFQRYIIEGVTMTGLKG